MRCRLPIMGWDAHSSLFSDVVDIVVGGLGSLCLFTVGLLAGGPVRPGAHQQHQGYCLKCRAKTPITGAREGYTSNGRRVLKGSCSRCGTKVNRFLAQNA